MQIGFSPMSMEAALGAARSWHNYRQRGGGRCSNVAAGDVLLKWRSHAPQGPSDPLLKRSAPIASLQVSFFLKFFNILPIFQSLESILSALIGLTRIIQHDFKCLRAFRVASGGVEYEDNSGKTGMAG
jgi:hypothetical protein